MSALRRQGVEQRPAPDRNRLYPLNAQAFDEIDNEQVAYFWGYLYADGCVSRRTLNVNIKPDDRVQLERLAIFLKSNAPIHHYNKKAGGKLYSQVSIDFTDRHLANRLRELGVIANRPHPECVFTQLPESLIRHWIRGYFDGNSRQRG